MTVVHMHLELKSARITGDYLNCYLNYRRLSELLFPNEEYVRRRLYVDRYSTMHEICKTRATRIIQTFSSLFSDRHGSRLDAFGIRVSSLQVPQEEEDSVRYLPLLGVAALLRLRILGIGARSQVALDLALVDEVVVVSFPNNPDAPGEEQRGLRGG
jgi:hypothetical protein